MLSVILIAPFAPPLGLTLQQSWWKISRILTNTSASGGSIRQCRCCGFQLRSSPTTCYSKEERLAQHSGDPPNLKRLTSRIVELTRRRQLSQVAELLPLQGFGDSGDLDSVLRIIIAMKSQYNLATDRSAYTATIDALLSCGFVKGALCVFGELVKHAGEIEAKVSPISFNDACALSARGDYSVVKLLHRRMWTDSAGTINPRMQEASDHLIIEGALNDGQIALHLEAMLGMDRSLFSPYLLNRVQLTKPIETKMIPFEAARPLKASLHLSKLNAELGTMMRSPPPCFTAATSIHRVFDLILEKKYKMMIVVKYNENNIGPCSNASVRAVGVFTSE